MDFRKKPFGVGSLACYENFEQVGEGTYGHVYRANDKRNGEIVALKRLIFHKESGGFPLCAVREIKFLKSLSHQNIVKLKDIATSKGCENVDAAVTDNSKCSVSGENRESKDHHQLKISQSCGNLYLVFEYVEHDLGGLIDAKFKFNSIAIKSIIKQLFAVLDYLDEKKIIHRDIKSSNILISNRHQVKLADFGLARSSVGCDGSEGNMDLTNNVVTMWYKSPELLLGAVRYTPAVDMWSAGCVLAELELSRPMLPGKTELEQLELICRVMGTPTEATWPGLSSLPNYETLLAGMTKFSVTFRSSYEKKLSEGVLGLLERVLAIDPSRRSSARLALAHKFFFTSPIPPADPTELQPLALPPGTSLHEFQTKQQNRRQKDEEARGVAALVQPQLQLQNILDGGAARTLVQPAASLAASLSMNGQVIPSSSSSSSSTASSSSSQQQYPIATAHAYGRDDFSMHGSRPPYGGFSTAGFYQTQSQGVRDESGGGGRGSRVGSRWDSGRPSYESHGAGMDGGPYYHQSGGTTGAVHGVDGVSLGVGHGDGDGSGSGHRGVSRWSQRAPGPNVPPGYGGFVQMSAVRGSTSVGICPPEYRHGPAVGGNTNLNPDNPDRRRELENGLYRDGDAGIDAGAFEYSHCAQLTAHGQQHTPGALINLNRAQMLPHHAQMSSDQFLLSRTRADEISGAHGQISPHPTGHVNSGGAIGPESSSTAPESVGFIPPAMPLPPNFAKPAPRIAGGGPHSFPQLHEMSVAPALSDLGQPFCKNPTPSTSGEYRDEVDAPMSYSRESLSSVHSASPFARGGRQQSHYDPDSRRYGTHSNEINQSYQGGPQDPIGHQSYRGGPRGAWNPRGGRRYHERDPRDIRESRDPRDHSQTYGRQGGRGGQGGRWQFRDQQSYPQQPHHGAHANYGACQQQEQQQQPQSKGGTGGDVMVGAGAQAEQLTGHKRPLSRQDP